MKAKAKQVNLGMRLNSIRKEKGMILDELAKKSKISRATLCSIENGHTQGSFKTHAKICLALDISIKEFYLGTKILEDEVASVQALGGEAAELFTYDERASSFILTSGVRKKNMLPQVLTIQPEGKTHLEQNPVGTEKLIFGLEGRLEVKVEDKIYHLQKNGALYFRSSCPHFIQNNSSTEARCLCVTSPVAL